MDATAADSLPGDGTLTGPRSGGQTDHILPPGYHDAGTRFGAIVFFKGCIRVGTVGSRHGDVGRCLSGSASAIADRDGWRTSCHLQWLSRPAQ